MALDLRAIREAVAERVKERCKINAYPYGVKSVVRPSVEVLPDSPFVEYHQTMRTRCQVNLLVVVTCAAADMQSAQIARDEFVSAGTAQGRSIFDALEDVADGSHTPNLDGAVTNIHVASVDAPPGVAVTENDYEFTATFKVTIQAERD